MSETIAVMTWAEWQCLPLATQEMLRKIGYPVPKEPHISRAKRETLHPAEKARRKFRRTTAGEEHVLILQENCVCCGCGHLHILHMQVDEEHDCLVAVRVHGPLPNLKKVQRTVETYSCKSCQIVLSEKSKDELIAMILALNDERKYDWPSERPEDEVTG